MDLDDRRRIAEQYGLVVDGDGDVSGLLGLGDGPIALVNFFALRPVARYDDGRVSDCSGVEAMQRYAAVSGERLEAVGGQFMTQALSGGVLWGDDEEWDLVVVAEYPSADAFLALLADPEYAEAFVHRRAAVGRQRVTVGVSIA